MDGMSHKCNFCNGIRPIANGLCTGCGTPVIRCKPPTIKRNNNECPGCTHTGPHQLLESGRYRCKCSAVFEPPDFGFLDDRPEVNAAKKERAESERRKRLQR